MSMAADGPHELIGAATRETPADLSFDSTLTNSEDH